MRALALVAAIAGCRSTPEHAKDNGEPGAAPSELRGKITVAGQPVTAAEVLAVVDGKVVAAAPATPSYQLPAIADCARASLIVRLSEPVLGVVPAAARCSGTVDVDVPARQVIELTGAIKLPDGVAFDWVELKLTPRLLAVPPTVVLAEGTSPDLREALAVRKLTRPAFALRVVAGSWTVRADRFVDAPPPAGAGNLVLDDVKLTGGTAGKPQRGSVDVELPSSSTLELALRVDAR